MDFVVVGFGLGALGLLLGLLLREAGAWWWRVRTNLERPAAEVVQRIAYSRACRAGGRMLTIGGAAACGMTLLALLAGLSDRAGASVVVGSLTVIGFAIGAWAIAYAHRYHPRPARPRPRRAQPIAHSESATFATNDADAIAGGAIVPVTSSARNTPTADDAVTAPEPAGTTGEDEPVATWSSPASTPRTDADRASDQPAPDAPISAPTPPPVDAAEADVPASALEAPPPDPTRSPKPTGPSTAQATETADLQEQPATPTSDADSAPPAENAPASPAGNAAPTRRGRFDRTLASIGKRD